MTELEKVVKKAFDSKHVIANMSTQAKNDVLIAISEALIKNKDEIIKANKNDYEQSKKKGLSNALLDRLLLDEKRIKQMADAIKEIVDLPDPVGEITSGSTRPNGLKLRQIRVPLGVVLIIYEARPNVTTDTATLGFKSGNVVILRGGSNSFQSNQTLVEIMQNVLKQFRLPEEIITFVPKPEREIMTELLKYNQYIDVLIPRGGKQLIEMVVSESHIPVIFHADGICHIYVDQSADKKMTESIVLNAKIQRPGVCNALETLLINKDYIHTKDLLEQLKAKGVELSGDKNIIKLDSTIKEADEEDWSTEYLDLILSVKTVNSLDEAIKHINHYGSHHTDSIITENYSNGEKFLKEVDSSSVLINASTRFSDGGQYGLGAEVGISTQKLHSRGPMGLKDLTCQKYLIYGQGQIRE